MLFEGPVFWVEAAMAIDTSASFDCDFGYFFLFFEKLLGAACVLLSGLVCMWFEQLLVEERVRWDEIRVLFLGKILVQGLVMKVASVLLWVMSASVFAVRVVLRSMSLIVGSFRLRE